MPKMKTNRAAMKRFRFTGTGKIRRNRAYHSHILTKKSPTQKRRLRTSTIVDPADDRNVRRMLGK